MALAVAVRIGAIPFHTRVARVTGSAPGAALPAPPRLGSGRVRGRRARLDRLQHLHDGDPAGAPSGSSSSRVGLLCIVLGILAATIQDDIEHVVGYSVIQDAGFVMLALAVLDVAAWEPARSWLLIYVATKSAFAGWALAMRDTFGTGRIGELSGWIRRAPFLAVALAIIVVATVGRARTARLRRPVADRLARARRTARDPRDRRRPGIAPLLRAAGARGDGPRGAHGRRVRGHPAARPRRRTSSRRERRPPRRPPRGSMRPPMRSEPETPAGAAKTGRRGARADRAPTLGLVTQASGAGDTSADAPGAEARSSAAPTDLAAAATVSAMDGDAAARISRRRDRIHRRRGDRRAGTGSRRTDRCPGDASHAGDGALGTATRPEGADARVGTRGARTRRALADGDRRRGAVDEPDVAATGLDEAGARRRARRRSRRTADRHRRRPGAPTPCRAGAPRRPRRPTSPRARATAPGGRAPTAWRRPPAATCRVARAVATALWSENRPLVATALALLLAGIGLVAAAGGFGVEEAARAPAPLTTVSDGPYPGSPAGAGQPGTQDAGPGSPVAPGAGASGSPSTAP